MPRLSARRLGYGCDRGPTVCAQQVLDGYESKRVSEWCWLWRAACLWGEAEVWANGFSPLCRGPPWMWRMGVWGSGKPRRFLVSIHVLRPPSASQLHPETYCHIDVQVIQAPLLPHPGRPVRLSVSSSVSSSMYCNRPSQALCCVTFSLLGTVLTQLTEAS